MKKPHYPFPHTRPNDDDERSPAWEKLFDINLIENILRDAARAGKALSYSETLYYLGYTFSRPKMRALCVALAEVDARAKRQGEVPLAVLVVRASDGLPGAGWWVDRDKYKGPREGPQAAAYIKKKQNETFKFWRAAKD